MRKRALLTSAAGLAVLALAACSSQSGASDTDTLPDVSDVSAVESIKMIVPADEGGGWDQTGRAVADVLTGEKLVSSVPVSNLGGAGGTLGLAVLAEEHDPHTLMVTGLVMVGAIETNQSPYRIENTTPIARLTEEPLVVVVPASSPYQSLTELVDDVAARGQDVAITGGSTGGADHILAGLLLEAAGVPGAQIPDKLNYLPSAGGDQALTLLLENGAGVGISGVGEFAEHIASGALRALAVSSELPSDALPGVPTMTDEGYPVVYTNWRGLLAPSGTTPADRAALTELVTEMHTSAAWSAVLKEKGWSDAFLTGADFDEFLTKNVSDVQLTLQNIGLIA